MPVEDRERLAGRFADEVAPRLRSAINRRDADQIAELTLGLDRQELLTLVVVLASQWPTTVGRPRKRVVCRGCRQSRRHEGHGLCRGCHVRRDAAGRPESGPPPAMPREEISRLGVAGRLEKRVERLEDCADLLSWGVADEEAAARLGVSVWTVREYKAAFRDGLQLRIPADREYQEAS